MPRTGHYHIAAMRRRLRLRETGTGGFLGSPRLDGRMPVYGKPRDQSEPSTRSSRSARTAASWAAKTVTVLAAGDDDAARRHVLQMAATSVSTRSTPVRCKMRVCSSRSATSTLNWLRAWFGDGHRIETRAHIVDDGFPSSLPTTLLRGHHDQGFLSRGAAAGIGLEIACAFASAGATVFITDINARHLRRPDGHARTLDGRVRQRQAV